MSRRRKKEQTEGRIIKWAHHESHDSGRNGAAFFRKGRHFLTAATVRYTLRGPSDDLPSNGAAGTIVFFMTHKCFPDNAADEIIRMPEPRATKPFSLEHMVKLITNTG